MKELKQLTEIKAGQTGTGLLIECDGYVSLDVSNNNKKIITEALNAIDNGEWNIPKPFVLDAILQKCDIENANKRIYPSNILRREVDKYQSMIQQRMALGECYTGDAQCLTEKGWKNITDVAAGESILTLNTTTNKTEYKIIENTPSFDWDGDMVHVISEFVDDFLTPSHKYPIYDSERKFYDFITIKELMENKEGYEDYMLPVSENICDGNPIFEKIGNMSFSYSFYNGKVYCVEVENHTWYVRQNGMAHWTKNCNHPKDTTIDLGRIAINVIECHWEGSTLLGKIEFNLTEGFRRYGICSSLGDTCANLIINGYKIGVSSRAVGSVENRLGKTIVGDDLDLICWDVVATPSTPGAYIGNKETLQQYVESKNITNKTQLSEKINAINKILI